MLNKKIIVIITVCMIGMLSAYATPMGVIGGSRISELPGNWYLGINLKEGDFFSYDLCHIDYKDCKEFQMDFWIEGKEIIGGNPESWKAHVVVYDGNIIKKGYMYLGAVSPEPVLFDDDIAEYVIAFKNSVTWLSAFN